MGYVAYIGRWNASKILDGKPNERTLLGWY